MYGDFESYKKGIYKRSKTDHSPNGGHAVKLVGWGAGPETDAKGDAIDYWLVANSWGPNCELMPSSFHAIVKLMPYALCG